MCISSGAEQEKEQKEESRSKCMLYVTGIGTPSSATGVQTKKSVQIGTQTVLSNVIGRCSDKIELCLAAKGWIG